MADRPHDRDWIRIDLVLFYEYFDGNTGRGLGASYVFVFCVIDLRNRLLVHSEIDLPLGRIGPVDDLRSGGVYH